MKKKLLKCQKIWQQNSQKMTTKYDKIFFDQKCWAKLFNDRLKGSISEF